MERTRPEEIFKKCAEEINRKAVEYGELGSDYDDMAAYEERKPTEVCFSLFMKHVTVLKKIAKNPTNFPLKIMEHRVMDAVNFLCVLQNEIEKYVERSVDKGLPTQMDRSIEYRGQKETKNFGAL
jgi:hypothetical protein